MLVLEEVVLKSTPGRSAARWCLATAFLVASSVSGGAIAAEAAPEPAVRAADEAPVPREPSAPVAPAPAAPVPTATPVPVTSIHPLASDDAPSRWYGWQTLTADGTALGLSIGGLALAGSASSDSDTPSEALLWGALSAYVLGGPVLHWAHGNPGRGFASLGLRAGAPLALAFMGAELEDCRHSGGTDFCGVGGALIGAALGVVAASTIDAAVFAYDDSTETAAARPRFRVGVGPRGVVAFGSF